jgi:short subunit dehydrogenase-like uncharacterized protein
MEAVRRGHRPVLAGRDPARLRALAEELAGRDPGELAAEIGHPPSEPRNVGPAPPADAAGARTPLLPWRAFPLDDPAALEEGIVGVDAVLHAAGPFIHTAAPMVEACLAAGVNYLDVTAEIPVFERVFDLHDEAKRRGIVLLPGVGLGVVPTDAAAALLAEVVPAASRLELALHSPGKGSAGTMRTIVEGIPVGLLVRRKGRLVAARPGAREFRRRVDFGPPAEAGPMAGRLGGSRSVAPFTWGDLSTAVRSTAIGEVTFYMARPRRQVRLLPVALPILRTLLSGRALRRVAAWIFARGSGGPDRTERAAGRARIWARVEDPAGHAAEVVLECPHGYRFTAIAGVRAVEEVLARMGEAPGRGDAAVGAGAFTPSTAFGSRWALGLPGVELISGPRRMGRD